MKRALSLFLVLSAILTSAAVASQPATYADARAQAAELGKPLLVDFYTEW